MVDRPPLCLTLPPEVGGFRFGPRRPVFHDVRTVCTLEQTEPGNWCAIPVFVTDCGSGTTRSRSGVHALLVSSPVHKLSRRVGNRGPFPCPQVSIFLVGPIIAPDDSFSVGAMSVRVFPRRSGILAFTGSFVSLPVCACLCLYLCSFSVVLTLLCFRSVVVRMTQTPTKSGVCSFCQVKAGWSSTMWCVCLGWVGRRAIPAAIWEMCVDKGLAKRRRGSDIGL